MLQYIHVCSVERMNSDLLKIVVGSDKSMLDFIDWFRLISSPGTNVCFCAHLLSDVNTIASTTE